MAVSGITCTLIIVCLLTFNISFGSSYCYKDWSLNTDGIDEEKITVNFGSHYIPDRGISLFWSWKTNPSSIWSYRFWYSPFTNKTTGGFLYRNKLEKMATYLTWRNVSGCVKWNSRGNRYVEQPAWNITTCGGHNWGFTPGNFREGIESYFHIGDLNMTHPVGEFHDGGVQSENYNTTRFKRQTETFPDPPPQPTKPKTFGEWVKQMLHKMIGRNGRGENFMTRVANWFISIICNNTTTTNTTSRSYPGQGHGFDVPEKDPEAEVIPVGEGRNDVEFLTERNIPKSRYPPKRLY